MKLDLSEYTLNHFFAKVVEKYASRPALAFGGENHSITYAEFGLRVENLKQALGKFGFKKGDKIILLGGSSPN